MAKRIIFSLLLLVSIIILAGCKSSSETFPSKTSPSRTYSQITNLSCEDIINIPEMIRITGFDIKILSEHHGRKFHHPNLCKDASYCPYFTKAMGKEQVIASPYLRCVYGKGESAKELFLSFSISNFTDYNLLSDVVINSAYPLYYENDLFRTDDKIIYINRYTDKGRQGCDDHGITGLATATITVLPRSKSDIKKETPFSEESSKSYPEPLDWINGYSTNSDKYPNLLIFVWGNYCNSKLTIKQTEEIVSIIENKLQNN